MRVRHRLVDAFPEVQAERVIVDVLVLRWVVLNHPGIVREEEVFQLST